MNDDHTNISLTPKAVESFAVMSSPKFGLEPFSIMCLWDCPSSCSLSSNAGQLCVCVCVEGLQSLHCQLSSGVSGPQLSFVICGPAAVSLKSFVTDFVFVKPTQQRIEL